MVRQSVTKLSLDHSVPSEYTDFLYRVKSDVTVQPVAMKFVVGMFSAFAADKRSASEGATQSTAESAAQGTQNAEEGRCLT